MREILFRGKRIDNGEWVVGHLLTYEDGRARINESHTEIFCYEKDRSIIQTVAYEVDPSTVGQYIGLTDKNGKRIFEGDIVEDASVGLLGDVVFSVVGVPSFGINDVNDGLQYHDGFWSDLEVIGNIHDNPELLKGGPDNGT